MKLRPFDKKDLDEVLDLFRETVHAINAADYSPEQLDAWAPERPDKHAWEERLTSSSSFVVETGGRIVGFGNLTAEGRVDTLYVHKNSQKEGIGAAIIMRLIAEAKSKRMRRIDTFASITARPFFEKEGFTVEREYERKRNGISFVNYVMALELPPAEERDDEEGEGET
jgi:putative acetyltransferase